MNIPTSSIAQSFKRIKTALIYCSVSVGVMFSWVDSRILVLSILVGQSSPSPLFAPEFRPSAKFSQSDSSSTLIAFNPYAVFASTPTAVQSFSAAKPAFALREPPRKVLIPGSPVAGNAKFTLTFDNPSANIVSQAKVYDLTGAEVADFREETPAGNDPMQLSWDGRDGNGSFVRSGIYIYQVQAEGNVINGTVVVAR